MRAISYFIFIFFAPALILLNFNFLVFNSAFYKSQFKKLNVYEEFESREIVDNQSDGLIDYLCCGKNLDENFFTERERLHLSDVKKIITLNQAAAVLLGGLVLVGLIILILKRDEKEFAKTIMGASAITVFALILLWLSALFNFDWFFLKFHFLAFDNELFPQQFLVNFANRVAIQTLVISAGLFLVSFYFLKRHDSKKH